LIKFESIQKHVKVEDQPKKTEKKPWRRGAVDIASASVAKRPGFESHHGFQGNIAVLLCMND
jgi:hypothetical protein